MKYSILFLTLFSALLLSSITVTMNSALFASDNSAGAGQQNLAQSTQGGGAGATGQPVIKPQDDVEDDDDNGDGTTTTTPNGGGGQPLVGQENRATSEQTGGISAGEIIQRSNTAVTEQYCKTIAGIGDRRCQQEAPEGALQECSAIAGLGKANCVQSENPDGSGTCLSANGRPFICETSTGKSISGSGQAGQ